MYLLIATKGIKMIKQDDEDNKISIIITIIATIVCIITFICFSYYSNNKTARENLIKAQDLFRKSEFQQAEKLLNIKPPKDIAEEFYKLKFEIQINQNAPFSAKETMLELLKLKPENAFYNYQLGLIYYNMQDYEQTQKYFKEAIKYEPKNFTYNISLANLYSEQNKYDEAINLYLDIYKANPKAEIALASIANCYEQQNDLNNALKYREKAAKEFSTNLFDIYILAQTYEKMNKKDKAIEYYAKAIDLDFEDNTEAKAKYKELSGKSYYPKGYKSISIPYRLQNNLMLVNAKLGGKKAEFLIDTGASFCVASEKFIKNIKTKNLGISAIVTLADGSKIDTPIVLADLTLNDFELGDILVAVIPNDNIDFLLGNNVLGELDYYVDHDRKVITIKRPKE